MKRFLCFILLAVLCLSCCTGCGREQTAGGVSVDALAEVWTEDAQAKILRNQRYAGKTRDSIELAMAKNEYQGAQIQVYAKENISSYNLEVSDLYSDRGVIGKDNIQVTVLKYMPIEMKSNDLKEFFIGAEIPDAMIPIESIRAFKEDKIVQGDNQGFFLDVYVPETTPGGVYTGTAKLTLKGAVKYVPIRVTVWDITLPKQLGTKNYWGLFKRNEQLAGELDTSDEMATKYFEFLLKYNVNCELLPFSPKDGPDGYVELLRKYYDYPGFNTYRFYHEWRDTMYGDDYVPWDVDCMRTYLKAVVRASVEDRVNYLDKAHFYMLGNMDEPHTPEAYDRCVVLSRAYGRILRELKDEMRMELNASDNYDYYLSTVSQTLTQIPCLLTLMNEIYYWQIKNSNYNVENMTVCLVMHGYDKQLTRDAVAQEPGEHWWYTCTGPVNPYPSTHLDDYAISARLIGWMQEAYDIDGYLNWGTFISRGEYGPSVYEGPASMGFSNGDGWIAYPGAWYHVDGPIASLRLVAVRDGMQDNALLRLFTQKYTEKGLNADTALDIYYKDLFDGTRVLVQDSERFYAFRNEVAETILKIDEADIIYDSIVIENSTAVVRFVVGNAVTAVTYKGEPLSSAGGVYTATVDLTETVTLVLNLTVNGATKTVTRELCGGYSLLDSCDAVENTVLKAGSTAGTPIALNRDAAYALAGNSLQVTLTGEDDPYSTFTPAFRIDAKDINGGRLSEIKSLTLNIYSTAQEDMAFSAMAWDGSKEQFLADVTLHPGWNTVLIPNLDKFGDNGLQMIRIKTENFRQAKVFYVDEISVIKV